MNKKIIYIVFFITLLLGSLKLFFYTQINIPLGYDPGIYIAIFKNYTEILSNLDLSLLASWNTYEPLIGILGAGLFKLGIDYHIMLTYGIAIASILPGFVILGLYYKENRTTALLSAGLYRISITQYELFHYAYFKQIIGISILLISLINLQRGKYIIYFFCFLVLLLLHRHTALFSAIVRFVYIFVISLQKKRLPRKLILGGTVAIVVAFMTPYLRNEIILPGLQAITNGIFYKGIAGIFVDFPRYLGHCFMITGFAFIYIVRYKKVDILTIARLISILRIILGFANYKRHIAFLDLFNILLVGQFLGKVLIKDIRKNIKIYVYTGLVFVLLSVQYLVYILNNRSPLISQEEFYAITQLDKKLPDNAVVFVSHRNYTPWIMGYSNRQWISPGLSDLDIRTISQWNMRWMNNGNTKCNMLYQSYKDIDIYRFIGSDQPIENIEYGDCFEPITTFGQYHIYHIFFG